MGSESPGIDEAKKHQMHGNSCFTSKWLGSRLPGEVQSNGTPEGDAEQTGSRLEATDLELARRSWPFAIRIVAECKQPFLFLARQILAGRPSLSTRKPSM